MRYVDVCAGYSASSVAWKPLGWECAGYSEIEPFPRAVLEQRHGAVPVEFDEHKWSEGQNFKPLFGDFTKIEAHHVGPIDLLVGGTPCQSFSIAGKRLGLDDPRGNLALEFLALARRLGTEWLVWENVPGVYSSWSGQPENADEGDRWEETADFIEFLNFFRECGFRGGWRTIDAQHTRVDGFGRAVPQRRRRVILVGHLGDGARSRSVLFDRESMCGNSPPSREAGQSVAGTLESRASGGGGGPGSGTDGACAGYLQPVAAQYDDGSCATVSSKWSKGSGGPSGDEVQNIVAFNSREDCVSDNHITGALGTSSPQAQAVAFKPSHYTRGKDGAPSVVMPPLSADADKGDQEAVIAFAQNSRDEVRMVGGDGSIVGALAAEPGMKQQSYVAQAFDMRGRDDGAQLEGPHDTASVRAASGGSSRSYVAQQWAVRRLTPTECERLQGVPDNFTQIEWRGKPADQCPDGPRYKAIGNSMAVNVMRWIGVRIDMVNLILDDQA